MLFKNKEKLLVGTITYIFPYKIVDYSYITGNIYKGLCRIKCYEQSNGKRSYSYYIDYKFISDKYTNVLEGYHFLDDWVDYSYNYFNLPNYSSVKNGVTEPLVLEYNTFDP